MFDLNTLALKTDSVFVQLRHPVTDELLADKDGPVGIYVYGTASKEYRAAVNAMGNRALKRGNKKATAEVVREEGVELLVAVTEKATDNLTYQGKPLNTPATFRELYGDASFSWIKDQVDAAIADTANFLAQ